MPTCKTADEVLTKEFLEIRTRILDLAAMLDRLDRATGDVATDRRMGMIRQGLAALESSEPGRAERVQLIFSLPYEAQWQEKMSVAKRG
ncbi:MAG: hypothetical protein JNM18_23700 [Planctomycetaceae bacterium]|nr:hypothetical protein [Planctomycetaceae bacterium]